MITHQPVNNHDDMQKVVDGILDEIGLSWDELDGKLTFAGLDPIMNTTLKVGAAGGILGAVNSLASHPPRAGFLQTRVAAAPNSETGKSNSQCESVG
jgi:hypothetical protein